MEDQKVFLNKMKYYFNKINNYNSNNPNNNYYNNNSYNSNNYLINNNKCNLFEIIYLATNKDK